MTTGGGSDGGSSTSTPWSPPVDLAGRVGLYAWGADTSAQEGDDVLAWHADQVAALGSRTLRVFIGVRDDYGLNPDGADSLAEIAAGEAYASLLADTRFDTLMLTAYGQVGFGHAWSDGLDADEAAAVRADFEALAAHLLASTSGKGFVLLPWEGDNALASFGHDPVAWQGYRDWLQARYDGVAAARAGAPEATSRVLVGVEFNRLAGCGPEPCVITDVAPHVDADLYSFSAWSVLAVEDRAELEPALTEALDAALRTVQAVRPEVSAADFLLGEYGAARDLPWNGECEAAARAVHTAAVALDWGATWALWWQVTDNRLVSPTSWSGFGAYAADGSRTLVADALAAAIAGGDLAVPEAEGCPSVNPDGTVDGLEWDHSLVPGEVASVFGHGFSESGNTVVLRQGASRWEVRGGSAWWESENQLNFTLPVELSSDEDLVLTVVDAQGLESNGDYVPIGG